MCQVGGEGTPGPVPPVCHNRTKVKSCLPGGGWVPPGRLGVGHVGNGIGWVGRATRMARGGNVMLKR